MYLGMTEEDLLVERGRPERGIDWNKDGGVSGSKLKHGSKIEKGWLSGTIQFTYLSDSSEIPLFTSDRDYPKKYAALRSYAWLKNGIVVAIQVHPEYLGYETWDEWGNGEFGVPTNIRELKTKFGEPTSSNLGFDEYERIYIWENHGIFCTIREGEFNEFGIFTPGDWK